LARHLRQRRADIVHSHNQRPHYLSTLAACLARVPVLINTRHGPSADASLRSRLNRRAMAALSQVIVAVSADTGDIAVRLDGIARRKLRIILNGTDLAAARFARGEARQRLDLCQGAFVIGAVGRLVPVKDHASFIAAFDRVRSQIPGVAAAILGDGPLAAELSAAARARGCDSLRFHGHRADAVALLPAFDLFVQPSLSEGISLSVIEAMAAGVPVIATSIGGNREAVGDSEAGVLVPPADVGALASAIVALACDPQARARLADAGRRRVEMRFSVDAMARAYDTLYLEEARQRGLDV
jgi:glycosyltransferase involved in cell wall biosynthesis